MTGMRTTSPHREPGLADEVLRDLPASLVRELAGAPVDALLGRLVDAGWRPGQLRARLGAEPSQGGPARDAERLTALLHELLDATPPDVAHAREVAERARARAARTGPPPASPEARARAIAEIRASLRGAPRRRPEPAPRVRPACSLCDGEGSYFVTREVHLCRRCVAVLATGEARLSASA